MLNGGVYFVIDVTSITLHNVSIFSWYQPAIDAVALALMREFNKLTDPQHPVQPLVYTTYQAYLRR